MPFGSGVWGTRVRVQGVHGRATKQQYKKLSIGVRVRSLGGGGKSWECMGGLRSNNIRNQVGESSLGVWVAEVIHGECMRWKDYWLDLDPEMVILIL